MERLEIEVSHSWDGRTKQVPWTREARDQIQEVTSDTRSVVRTNNSPDLWTSPGCPVMQFTFDTNSLGLASDPTGEGLRSSRLPPL